MRKRIRQSTWIKVHRTEAIKKQKDKCIWCCSKLYRHTATAEHLHPKSHGGTDNKKNIAAACWRCNISRGTMPVAKFKKLIRDKRNAPKPHLYQCQIIYRINKRTDSVCKNILKFGR